MTICKSCVQQKYMQITYLIELRIYTNIYIWLITSINYNKNKIKWYNIWGLNTFANSVLVIDGLKAIKITIKISHLFIFFLTLNL